MSQEDRRESRPIEDADSRMLRCVACGQFFPAQDGKKVPASRVSGGRCRECGNSEFERVVLDPEHD